MYGREGGGRWSVRNSYKYFMEYRINERNINTDGVQWVDEAIGLVKTKKLFLVECKLLACYDMKFRLVYSRFNG